MMYDVDPFISLAQSKDVAFRACTRSRLVLLNNTPTTLGAELFVACTTF